MSKQNNLKDYLTDLYQGIASKKPGASRNPQNFRSEIESIKGGGDPWDETFTLIGIPTGDDAPGGGEIVIIDVAHSVSVVQPSKYFLGGIPVTASVAVNDLQNLIVTKGE